MSDSASSSTFHHPERSGGSSSAPASPAPAVLRVATYNVHACVGMDRKRSEERIAEVVSELSVDIVGLQELDFGRLRSGKVDQARLIAGQLGWRHYFHPAIRKGDEHYGDAVISRYPLTVRQTCDLPGTAPFYCRENRIAIFAKIETPLGEVHLINSHFGLARNERLLQAELMAGADWAGSAPADTPLVLMGDFNSLPGSPPHRAIARQLRDIRALVEPAKSLRTFPTFFPSFAIDHIFINRALHVRAAHVHRSPLARLASDHYPLVADLELAKT